MTTIIDVTAPADPMLEQVVDELGIVSLPALVDYLMAAHPTADPYRLAEKVVRALEGGPNVMPLAPLTRPN